MVQKTSYIANKLVDNYLCGEPLGGMDNDQIEHAV